MEPLRSSERNVVSTNGQCENPLEYTGERMVPEKSDPRSFWAHVYRYRFARRFVENKRVLDIACGEGYGAHALASGGALSVIGIDISAQACDHARAKYKIDARQGSAEAIPLPDRCVDVVVSFETIEHVPNPGRFLDECNRVLTTDGVLIISTPEVQTYNEELKKPNPYHCSEMTEEEFVTLLRSRFVEIQIFSQLLKAAAWWSPRSMAAERSPWREVKGYWRLRSFLLTHNVGEVDESFRQSPAQAVLAREGLLSRLVNEFSVRKRSRRSGEKPEYLLVVARKA